MNLKANKDNERMVAMADLDPRLNDERLEPKEAMHLYKWKFSRRIVEQTHHTITKQQRLICLEAI